MVIAVDNDIELKKVDAQGRIVLPVEWRESDLKGSDEVFVIKKRGYLKILPKKRGDLTKFFDSVDLGVDVDLDDKEWDEIEEEINRKNTKRE